MPIVNNTCNDLLVTVLDNAPVDPATGLPVPTIFVATATGLSIIKDDGTVTSKTITGNSITGLTFSYPYISFDVVQGANFFSAYDIRTITTSTISNIDSSDTERVWQYAGVTATGLGIKYWLSAKSQTPNAWCRTRVSTAIGSSYGLTQIYDNPATPTKGLGLVITGAYNTGWLPGDIRGAYLADSVAETITASGELVTNGTFTTDTSGWTAIGSATIAVASGELQITSTGTANCGAKRSVTCVIGKTYTVVATGRRGTCTSPVKIDIGGISSAATNATTSNATLIFTFVANATAHDVQAYIGGAAANGETAFFDNISVKLADPDRSVKNKGLVVNGTLTKTPVASGANLVAWSGFSASNFLERPQTSDLDFATGDFCFMGWGRSNTITQSVQSFVQLTNGTKYIRVGRDTSGGITYPLSAYYAITDGTYSSFVNGATAGLAIFNTGVWVHIAVVRIGNFILFYNNGVLVNTSASIAGLNMSMTGTSTLRIGSGFTVTGYEMSMALWRVGATAPSADQIAHIYRTELPLFQTNAKCTIDGTSSSVTALSYDETTDELHVGTSWGRSEFKDLLRVASETTTTGAITSLSANQGAVLTGGASSGRIYVPAYLLRDELRRKDEARAALGRRVVGQEFTVTSGQTAFVIRKGYDVRFVYVNGLLKRLTTDYTVSDDGFQKTVTMTSGVPISQPVTIMITRS